MHDDEPKTETELGGQMSFLDHLDELRRRLVRAVLIIIIAFIFCWRFSGEIYNFLAVPVQRALAEATQNRIENGENFTTLREENIGKKVRYVFERATNLGSVVLPVGTSIDAKIGNCEEGRLCFFTDEDLVVGNMIVPKGFKLPQTISKSMSLEEQLIVTTAQEPFTLYVTVSLYAAIALSVPFLLWQIWGFISPALYKHERRYVTPFIGLSTISFILGAAFAYYVLFPPAVKYLLGLGEDFRLMLRATDYFDLITLIMLAMGIIFQMPAISYVLARIGIISAGFLMKSWKYALVIILILAAVISPTGDIPNMMLFATPMVVLYLVSIFVAWLFGKKRVAEPII